MRKIEVTEYSVHLRNNLSFGFASDSGDSTAKADGFCTLSYKGVNFNL